MNVNREYKELSKNIHAPEALKSQVLQEAVRSETKKKRDGRYSRGWSVMQKAAVAAILVIALPITAYAAAKGLGLMDYLAGRGMQNMEAVEALHNDATELTVSGAQTEFDEQGLATVRNDYAEYTILEAVCDSSTIFMEAKVVPLEENTLLLPSMIFEEMDSAECLGIEGVSGGTVCEYAAANGLNLVHASVGYWVGEKHLDGSEDFRYGEDGALYLYYSAHNISGDKEITLNCAGTAYTPEMTVANRVEFEVTLTDKSSTVRELVYRTFDAKAWEETGIQINSLTFKVTEMGLYATFTYSVTDAKFNDIDFKIVDAAGEELAYLPGEMGSGTIDNGDGTFSRTNNYQIPVSMEGLRFVIRDFQNSADYGPYSFE